MFWPMIVGPKPKSNASIDAKLDFVNHGVFLVGFTIVCFAIAVIGAIFVVRQAREEYNEAQAQNLQSLIEGTQEDIRKKQNGVS